MPIRLRPCPWRENTTCQAVWLAFPAAEHAHAIPVAWLVGVGPGGALPAGARLAPHDEELPPAALLRPAHPASGELG